MNHAKTEGLQKRQTLTLLNDFLHQFQNLCNQPETPIAADLAKFLAANFKLFSNGEVLCKDLESYLERITTLRSKYAHFDIVGPLQEPLFCEDNKILVQYELDLRTRDAKQERVYIMAVATLEDGKVTQWEQTTHEKGQKHWD